RPGQELDEVSVLQPVMAAPGGQTRRSVLRVRLELLRRGDQPGPRADDRADPQSLRRGVVDGRAALPRAGTSSAVRVLDARRGVAQVEFRHRVSVDLAHFSAGLAFW